MKETFSKIIIKNKTKHISDTKAVELVSIVVKQGLISNGTYGEQYCFMTTFKDDIRVWASKTKNGTHTFDVYID